jgi:hypothetical protein
MKKFASIYFLIFFGVVSVFCIADNLVKPTNIKVKNDNIIQNIGSLGERISVLEKQENNKSDQILKLSSLVLSVFAFSISLFHICMTWRKPKLIMHYKDDFLSNYQSLSVKRNGNDLRGIISINIKVSNLKNIVAKNCSGKILCYFINDKLMKTFFPQALIWKSGMKSVDLSKGEYDYLGIFEGVNRESYMNIQAINKSDVKIYKNKSYIFKIGVYSINANPIYSWYRLDPDYKLTKLKRAKYIRYENDIKLL